MNAFFALIACACIMIGRRFPRTQSAMQYALDRLETKCGDWARIVRFVFDAVDTDFSCVVK
jgi:hypothetical protein